MLFLIDGYNVTMRDRATSGLSKEGQRDALVARLRVRGRGLLGTGEIVAVFDAHAQLGVSSETEGGVRVAYAASADDEIVRRCQRVGGKVVVVTDDLRLRARISQDVGRHVEYRDASTVCDAASPKSKRPSGAIGRDEGLPKGANEINEWYKKQLGIED